MGLSTKPWTGDTTADPLTRTIVDYMALVETSLGTAEVAKMLEGEWRLPRFQFERGKVLPGLAAVLGALPTELNPLDLAEWFLEANPDLQADDDPLPFSPREWLFRGRSPELVSKFARHL